MLLSTTKEKILNAVLAAERVTGKKETLPVLSCLFFEAEKRGELVVSATNLEAGVEVRVPADVEEGGVVAVSSATVSQTLRSIGGDKVKFKTEDGNLIVESRGTRTLIKAVSHEEFPKLSGVVEKGGISVTREKLLSGIQAVLYAASPSMIRPELGSVYISLGEKGITCVATDSFRLAERVMGGGGRVEVLLPLKHALELVHVLERAESEDAQVIADESQLTVRVDGIRFVSRVVDGTFPNYKEIIPKKTTTEATILKSDLAEMLKKARVFSGNDQHVGLHVYPKKKLFTATARSADIGEMSDSIDAALSGEDLDINFHIGYLADCLPVIAADSVALSFSGAGKPLIIRGVSDPSFTYLVMPLNR